MNGTLPGLLQEMLKPDIYPHPVSAIELIETHISWIILTGDYAYKIKKPVSLGFLDFSTLEKRHFYCDEELRLNRRLAPDLYLDCVSLFSESDHLALHAPGSVIEYAVQMRQFDPADELHHLAKSGCLEQRHIDQLAVKLAEFHSSVARAETSDSFGSPANIEHYTLENLSAIQPCLKSTVQKEISEHLQTWFERRHRELHQVFINRKDEGFIRECHGDLHLGNIVCLEGQPTPFDCLEFNSELRWIDVMSELAFLLMDLEDHGLLPFARRMLNLYLGHTGDYGGLAVLNYYKTYRALVRAKVACIRVGQGDSRATLEMDAYLRLASSYMHPQTLPLLAITHGLSGSGKSHLADRLVDISGTIQLRSDIERKRLFGYAQNAKTPEKDKVSIYSQETTGQTYYELARLAQLCLQAGYSVIVDATFLRRRERQQFQALAEEHNWRFAILNVVAEPEILRRRIRARIQEGSDPSEATPDVLKQQIDWVEAINENERCHVREINTRYPVDYAQLAKDLGLTADAGTDSMAN